MVGVNQHSGSSEGDNTLFVLVDYDNVVPTKERTEQDVYSNLEFVFFDLCPQVSRSHPSLNHFSPTAGGQSWRSC